MLGRLTPVACAGVIGTMVLAWITNRRKNEFFIFCPGEGYEYVMTPTLIAVGLGGVGAGGISVDHALGRFDPPGWLGLAMTVVAGFGGAAGLLLTFWRPKEVAT